MPEWTGRVTFLGLLWSLSDAMGAYHHPELADSLSLYSRLILGHRNRNTESKRMATQGSQLWLGHCQVSHGAVLFQSLHSGPRGLWEGCSSVNGGPFLWRVYIECIHSQWLLTSSDLVIPEGNTRRNSCVYLLLHICIHASHIHTDTNLHSHT